MSRTIARPAQVNWWMFAVAFLLGLLIQNVIFAQVVHHLINGNMPPGKATEAALRTHPEWIGHSQAVKLITPEGAIVSYWAGNGFVDARNHEVTVGMQLGPVYRMKISKIRDYPGVDLYPSVELVSRLHPPAGQEQNFPIPILLTEYDLEQAAEGKMITRVIYLEDPETALPFAKPDHEMETTDIGGYEDPLHVAEGLGRPMAIVRLGSRQPLPSEMQEFAFHGPNVQLYPEIVPRELPVQPVPVPLEFKQPPAPLDVPEVRPGAGDMNTRAGLPVPYQVRKAARSNRSSFSKGGQR